MSDGKWSLDRLDAGARNSLKRNAGQMIGNDYQALEAFYRAVGYVPKSREQEEQWFACVCMECLWKPEDHPQVVLFEEMLRRKYHQPDTSDSIKRRIISLADVPWSRDGFLLGKLNNFSRMFKAESGSVMPNFDRLAEDLAQWNRPEHQVQRRWIRTICEATEKEETNTDNLKDLEEASHVD